MKPLHECAVVKDGNKRVAYFITETNNFLDIDNIILKPWRLIDSSKFEQLVANNQVQFLTFENNTIKCNYTLEEMNALKRRLGKNFVERSQENYWSMDMSFKNRHVQAATAGKAIACCCASIEKIFGMYMIPIYMYGTMVSMTNMIHELEKEVGASLANMFKYNGYNIGVIILPLMWFDKLVEKFGTDYKLLFDTSTIKFIIKNDINTPKIPLIRGKADPEKILKIIERLDRLTLKNEELLEVLGVM